MREASFRALPSVDRLMRSAEVSTLLDRFSRGSVLSLVRQTLQETRDNLSANGAVIDEAGILSRIVARAAAEWMVTPRAVVNASGVILHTNLGRAPLSDDAIAAVAAASAYADLEFNLSTGERGSRLSNVHRLLKTLTGAEASHVASNAAGALTLALAALARGKDVVVSRGHAVEIGGGFRVPTVLRQSGARLVEVGTTNRTRLDDYRDAITARTTAILHVHSSNFRIVGFTESVEIAELAKLARGHGIALVVDNGSGSFLDTSAFGLAHEPTPVEALQAGADAIAFSGDKLLGGPQAGILIGRADLLRRISSHPLARAMRPDKMAIAALSATLLAYIRGDAETTIPIWRMISAPLPSIERRATKWAGILADAGISVELVSGESTIGGGSLPGETLPTCLVVLPGWIRAGMLRNGPTPVIGRAKGNRTLLDPRTVLESQEEALFATLRHVAADRRDGKSMADLAL